MVLLGNFHFEFVHISKKRNFPRSFLMQKNWHTYIMPCKPTISWWLNKQLPRANLGKMWIHYDNDSSSFFFSSYIFKFLPSFLSVDMIFKKYAEPLLLAVFHTSYTKSIITVLTNVRNLLNTVLVNVLISHHLKNPKNQRFFSNFRGV